jgi:hypothetical protein
LFRGAGRLSEKIVLRWHGWIAGAARTIVAFPTAAGGGRERLGVPRRRLGLLRRHPVFGLEIMSGVSDELRVAWMIDRLDADDLVHQLRIVLADVLDELGLGIGRTSYQNRAGVGNRLRHRLQKRMIFGGMAAADGIGLVVDVPGRMIRVQYQLVDVGWAEMENAAFMVIDPDDGMKVMSVHKRRLL